MRRLRVWHIPQIPGKSSTTSCRSATSGSRSTRKRSTRHSNSSAEQRQEGSTITMTGSSIPTRTPAMILADALVKHRVLKGIALLEEKHGPDWADKIDLDTLDLGSASFCVLGQLYRDPDVVTDDVVETYRRSSRALRWVGKRIDEEFPSLRSTRETLKYGVSGYERGIAVLDGPLLDDDVWGLSRHGFESDVIYFDGLVAMSDEKLADLGVTRQMVNDALSDTRRYVRADYEALTEEWTGAINARKGAA